MSLPSINGNPILAIARTDRKVGGVVLYVVCVRIVWPDEPWEEYATGIWAWGASEWDHGHYFPSYGKALYDMTERAT